VSAGGEIAHLARFAGTRRRLTASSLVMDYDARVAPGARPDEARPDAVADSDAAVLDEAVVARVIGGETALFEVLMRRHNRRVYRAARSILRAEADVEDVMQETYVAAFQHLADLSGRAKFSTWITRIAVNAALQRLRRTRTAAVDFDADVEEATMTGAKERSPEEAASDVELRAVLEETIDALPAQFRAVFVLRAVEEMSVGETSEALGIPEETVRTRLHRARLHLREEVGKRLDRVVPATFDFHLSRCDRVVAAVLKQILG